MFRAGMAMAAIALLGASLPPRCAPKHPQGAATQQSVNLVGEIMDSRCAIDGSHDKMMRQNGTKNLRDCTLQCAKNGGSFVLIDPETQIVYQLDDQQKPAKFAGQLLRVSGTYEQSSKTMHVESIQSADSNKTT
jgi:hypothetical protein